MGWVGIQSSDIEFTFSELVGGSGSASLSGSVATTDNGTPPVAGPYAAWEIIFADAVGRADLLLRVTAQSYADSGDSAFPSVIAVANDSGAVVGDSYENTAGSSAWAPSPMEFEVVFGSGNRVLTNRPTGEFSAQTSAFLIEVWQEDAADTSYNCECDDDYPRATLVEMRTRLMRRLGFSAQAANPPPGMAALLDDFIRQAQEMLFRRYSVFRRERWFTWDLVAGTRFYDLDTNADTCTKRLEPRMISWAGISQGDDSWQPLVCGIDPVLYSSRGPGIPSHYEIRQCIELWPAPSDATWKLRVKGQFGLLPLEADDDVTSIDPEVIFLFALANAKAHYGQPDANNYASMATSYMRDLIRGSHMTRRYIPGEPQPINAVRPIPVGGWPT